MKKIAVASVLLLAAMKTAEAACSSVAADPAAPAKIFSQPDHLNLLFYLSFVLFVPVLALYFLRNYRGLWTVIVSTLSLSVFIPVITLTALFNECSDGPALSWFVKGEFSVMVFLLTFQ